MLDCPNCRARLIKKIMRNYESSGLTHGWQYKPEWRLRWWFFGKCRLQQKQVKIASVPGMLPHSVYRWKTIALHKNREAALLDKAHRILLAATILVATNGY